MNKEKIEEIYMDTLKLTDDEWVAKYGEGNGYHEAFETLIQQEREEAVRGFVTDFIETGVYEGVGSIEDIMKLWRKYNAHN